MVVMGALLIALLPRLLRHMVGASILPPTTDPVDLVEAKRQLRRGGLHERDEVNRAARIVAAQAEAKAHSPKTLIIMGVVGSVFFAGLALLAYLAEGAGFSFWLQLSLAVFLMIHCLAWVPWAKRYRRRARDFASRYDVHQQERRRTV